MCKMHINNISYFGKLSRKCRLSLPFHLLPSQTCKEGHKKRGKINVITVGILTFAIENRHNSNSLDRICVTNTKLSLVVHTPREDLTIFTEGYNMLRSNIYIDYVLT